MVQAVDFTPGHGRLEYGRQFAWAGRQRLKQGSVQQTDPGKCQAGATTLVYLAAAVQNKVALRMMDRIVSEYQ